MSPFLIKLEQQQHLRELQKDAEMQERNLLSITLSLASFLKNDVKALDIFFNTLRSNLFIQKVNMSKAI